MLKQSKQNNKVNPKSLLTAYQRKIENSLTDKGVILFDNESGLLNINDEYLVMPDLITDVPSRDLGEHLNAFTQHKVYIRTMLGRVELLVEEARRHYFDVSDPLYRKYSNSKMTETAKERLINNAPAVKESYDIYMDTKRQQSVVQYSLENIEDIIFLISREISRRGADFEE
jgi:hypothetical protein